MCPVFPVLPAVHSTDFSWFHFVSEEYSEKLQSSIRAPCVSVVIDKDTAISFARPP